MRTKIIEFGTWLNEKVLACYMGCSWAVRSVWTEGRSDYPFEFLTRINMSHWSHLRKNPSWPSDHALGGNGSHPFNRPYVMESEMSIQISGGNKSWLRDRARQKTTWTIWSSPHVIAIPTTPSTCTRHVSSMLVCLHVSNAHYSYK